MKKAAIILFVMFVLMIPLTLFAMSQASRDTRIAGLVLSQFHTHLQTGDYDRAHALLSNHLRDINQRKVFEQQWSGWQKKNGAIQKWIPAAGAHASAVSLMPRYVDFTYFAQSSNGNMAYVAVRMIPEDGTWRIDRLNARR
jgi:hypothetical protein